MRPVRTRWVWQAANAVSSPVTPKGASSNGTSFSSAAWGAWSVAMQSRVPSASAAISASRSDSSRSGGFILWRVGSSDSTAASCSVRWWGVTSALMRTPRSLARRISSAVSAAETWQMWMRPPSYSASAASRATATLSEIEGMPPRPSRVATASLVHDARPRQVRVLLVEHERQPGDALVLQRAAHDVGVGDRVAVVAEAGRAGLGQLDLLGELGALLAPRDRGQEADAHGGLLLAALEQRLEHRGGVHHRRGVGHGHDGHEAPGGGGEAAGGDVLEVLAPRRAQVHVRVDEAGDGDEAGRVDLLEPVGRAADAPVAHDQVAHLVDAGRRIEDADTAKDERGGRAASLDEPGAHQTATAPICSAGSATPAGSARRS